MTGIDFDILAFFTFIVSILVQVNGSDRSLKTELSLPPMKNDL